MSENLTPEEIRRKSLCALINKGCEAKIIIPGQVFVERNSELFQEQQEALENLKQDRKLDILEDEIKEETIIDGIRELSWYKVVTIKIKKRDRYESNHSTC